MKKLYQQIWFYKEYIIIFFIGISTIIWLMFSLGFSQNNIPKKSLEKPKFNVEIAKKSIILPDKNILISSIKGDQIDKKIFMEKYKNNFKAINSIKGKVNMVFNFYTLNEKVNSVNVIIKHNIDELDEIIIKNHNIRILINN